MKARIHGVKLTYWFGIADGMHMSGVLHGGGNREAREREKKETKWTIRCLSNRYWWYLWILVLYFTKNDIISGAIVPTSTTIRLHLYPIWEVASVDESLWANYSTLLTWCSLLYRLWLGPEFMSRVCPWIAVTYSANIEESGRREKHKITYGYGPKLIGRSPTERCTGQVSSLTKPIRKFWRRLEETNAARILS